MWKLQNHAEGLLRKTADNNYKKTRQSRSNKLQDDYY